MYNLILWAFVKLKHQACFLLLIMLFAINASAQQSLRVINGVITDDKNLPLPGVAVSAKGSGKSTSSDVNGKFSIQINGNDDVIRFTFLGFVTKEMPAG
ncbi:MAG: SusC/RagA family TonB-linked outer membrane protein, partial [Mucilaginibacter sp.]|nr:SusC/RagA family TonB-linked outer membrane protein [Mucilaginibacter sp.]